MIVLAFVLGFAVATVMWLALYHRAQRRWQRDWDELVRLTNDKARRRT